MRSTMKENVPETRRDPLSRHIKDPSGFALLAAMSMMVAVSLVILRFALPI